MGAPTSLLGQARAFARDFARDQMPRGYLWDVTDYVPTTIDAGLTGRGAWIWGSAAMGGDPEAGILATYSNGDKLLFQATDGHLYEVSEAAGYAVTDRGALPRAVQNQIQVVDTVVHFDGSSATVPKLITNPGGTITIANMDAAAPKAKYGIAWGKQQDYVVSAGVPGNLNYVFFSPPGNPSAAWDVVSKVGCPRNITGLAALRAVIIVFHAGATSRIRGTTPPFTGDGGNSDMHSEPLFDRVGCTDARSIAYWQDNVVFADEHGIHVTDGAVIRNLISQGGILTYWRPLYQNKVTLAACTFLDYYILTVVRSDAVAVTLICDLTKRQWFKFSNIPAISYVASPGATGMERIWAGMQGTNRLGRLGPCFFPVLETAPIVDANGVNVLPTFETPWYRMTQEGRKRVRFAYLSYDARSAVGVEVEGQGEELGPPPPPPEVLAALAPVLDVGYITSPQRTAYTSVGVLPGTTEYARYRLPVGRLPYGIAFRVAQTAPTTATRIFDLGVEAQGVERSRI
jgi:hypothetical protein